MRLLKSKKSVDILMYHSISDGPGPTCIPVEVFRAQLSSLEANGFEAVSLSKFADWRRGESQIPSRPVVITFDDGFLDFMEVAYPELHSRGWTSTVFLPTGLVGVHEEWPGHLKSRPRRLMSWDQIGRLSERGIEFGGHSISHVDLTSLSLDALRTEIRKPQEEIRQQIGRAHATSFAPPYGRSTELIRDEIRKVYRMSVGTKLGAAGRRSDLYDLPRIEMHYFRSAKLWDGYLKNRRSPYLTFRKILRTIRSTILG